eukprot:TRINITY_DN3491_c0_g1_i1.p1 TRINITY_DN3491_c0_g1~~TRINITY_DN3491_c0_g1_i1.p1  ORF type:complete len:214 (+),score=46.93 TRINITY_DN3491_c0_g1_i1:153-794(+)
MSGGNNDDIGRYLDSDVENDVPISEDYSPVFRELLIEAQPEEEFILGTAQIAGETQQQGAADQKVSPPAVNRRQVAGFQQSKEDALNHFRLNRARVLEVLDAHWKQEHEQILERTAKHYKKSFKRTSNKHYVYYREHVETAIRDLGIDPDPDNSPFRRFAFLGSLSNLKTQVCYEFHALLTLVGYLPPTERAQAMQVMFDVIEEQRALGPSPH